MADFDADENQEIKNVSDSQLMRIIPSKSDALSSGVISSFSLSNGKMIKATFAYMTIYQDFNFTFYPQGFQMDQILLNDTGSIDTASYTIFKSDMLVEYTYCPQNGYASDKIPESITINVNAKDFFACIKKAKAQTSIRVELNRNNPKLIVNVINGASSKPYYIDYKLTQQVPCPVNGDIIKQNIPVNFKTLIEVFCSEMACQSTKYNGVFYDFNIAVYNEGIYVWSDATGVGGVPYGKVEGSYHSFSLKTECAKRWSGLFRMSDKSTLSVTALDNNVIKLSMPIGSFGNHFIFQYPKMTNAMLTWISQRSSVPQQISSYNTLSSVMGSAMISK